MASGPNSCRDYVQSKYPFIHIKFLRFEFLLCYLKEYELHTTKQDIDNYYGFDDIIFEDFELENRKQKYNLLL